MTAPTAPTIRVRFNGTTIRVLWQPVESATDYKLYAGAAAAPTGLEADIPDADEGADGWFQYSFVPEDMTTYVRLTALNLLAEESGYSNEVRVMASGSVGASHGQRSDPFGNDRYNG